MATITLLTGSDGITTANSMTKINTNATNLNSDKIETSYLDTDTTLAANSDSKIATQKAVKAYVDAGGNVNASETTKGIVEEATDAEVTAGTATGATGAKLFVTPAKLATRIGVIDLHQTIVASSTPVTSADTERTFTGVGSGAAVLKKQITSNFVGYVRIMADLKNDTPPRASQVDIKINGVTVGTIQNDTSAYVTQYIDGYVYVGDVITYYCYVGNTSTGYIKNARLGMAYATIDLTGTVNTD